MGLVWLQKSGGIPELVLGPLEGEKNETGVRRRIGVVRATKYDQILSVIVSAVRENL